MRSNLWDLFLLLLISKLVKDLKRYVVVCYLTIFFSFPYTLFYLRNKAWDLYSFLNYAFMYVMACTRENQILGGFNRRISFSFYLDLFFTLFRLSWVEVDLSWWEKISVIASIFWVMALRFSLMCGEWFRIIRDL